MWQNCKYNRIVKWEKKLFFPYKPKCCLVQGHCYRGNRDAKSAIF